MDGYPQRYTIFEFDYFIYFISLVRSLKCFLFSLLFMRILLASVASWFRCIAVLSLYFPAYLPARRPCNNFSATACDMFILLARYQTCYESSRKHRRDRKVEE